MGQIAGALIGLVLLFYTAYAPVYLLILDSDVNAVQNATLNDVAFGATDLVFETTDMTGLRRSQISSVKSMLKEYKKNFEKVCDVDTDMTFEKALKKNKNITNISFSEIKSVKMPDGNYATTVLTEFTFKNDENVKIVSAVKGRKFFNPTLAKFVRFISMSINDGNSAKDPTLFIAQHIFGVKNTQALQLIVTGM